MLTFHFHVESKDHTRHKQIQISLYDYMRSTSALFNYAIKTNRKHGVLFTAGPLSTSRTVREAQLEDYGSRDSTFVNAIKEMREGVLRVAAADAQGWTTIPMQGSGTMGIEAVINSIVAPPAVAAKKTKFLVIRNGAYSYRMGSIVDKRGASELIPFDVAEGEEIDLIKLQSVLQSTDNISNVGVVHCETSTGMFNPIEGVSALVRRYHPKATIFVDAMSSFGGVTLNVPEVCDVLVTSANKCMQGVPGFSLVVAKRSLLDQCRGWSPSYTLDIVSQNDGLDKTGQFSNTPPVQAIMAFQQALKEHEAEGGVAARAARYRANNDFIADAMTDLGFRLFLDRTKPSFGHIITAYHAPQKAQSKNWDFMTFYNELKKGGFVIYPGKASFADTFRIGSLGDIHMADCKALMEEVRVVLKRMDVQLK
jgi:2-aminoethylphosphonate-pyruvate transaminase